MPKRGASRLTSSALLSRACRMRRRSRAVFAVFSRRSFSVWWRGPFMNDASCGSPGAPRLMTSERHSTGVSLSQSWRVERRVIWALMLREMHDALWSPQHRLPLAVRRADDVHSRRDGAVDRNQVGARLEPADRGFRHHRLFERASVAQHASPLHRRDRAEPVAALPPQRSADRHLSLATRLSRRQARQCRSSS